MKRESPQHISLMTKGRKKNEVHQESLLLIIQKEYMTNFYIMLNASIVTRYVIMLVTIPKGTKDITTTLEETLITKEERTIKRRTMVGDMKEE